MARTATITLDGREYVIRAFNLKQIQQVGEILSKANGADFSVGGQVLAIALQRADPPVDANEVEPTLPEITKATETILKLAGIETDANPPAAAPAETS